MTLLYRVYKWFSQCGEYFSFFMDSMGSSFQQHSNDPTTLRNNFTVVLRGSQSKQGLCLRVLLALEDSWLWLEEI